MLTRSSKRIFIPMRYTGLFVFWDKATESDISKYSKTLDSQVENYSNSALIKCAMTKFAPKRTAFSNSRKLFHLCSGTFLLPRSFELITLN